MRTPKPALLATFWFGIQALWGALLGIALQARTSELAPDHALVAYGQLAAAGAFTAVVMQLIMGPLSDRLRSGGRDRRVFLISGALAGCIGIFGFFLAPSFAWLFSALVFLQIAVNAAIGPYQAIIPDYFAPSQAGRASAWMAAFQSLGNAVGAVCAVLLLGSPFALAAILACVLLLTCAITVLHMTRVRPRTIDRVAHVITRVEIDLFVSRAILWTGFYTVLGYVFFYVHDTLGIPDAVRSGGIVVLIFTACGTIGAALTAKPADAFDRRFVVNVAVAVFILGLLGFVAIRDARAMYVAAAVAGTGWGGFLAADWALGCTILPPGLMATAMGIWNIAVAGPQILAPALATWLIFAAHSRGPDAPVLAFVLAMVQALVGALWIWRIPGRKQE